MTPPAVSILKEREREKKFKKEFFSEENQLNSAKSNEINQESDYLLSELLFKNEFSINSAYSSEYCFTPEEIGEFTNKKLNVK